jgi:nicotinamidase-related amidase
VARSPASALLVIDMISDFAFEDGPRLFPRALAVARRIRRLKQRCRAARIPVLYVNDNFGRWRSDFRQLVGRCLAKDSLGAPIVELLHPEPSDYFVLKPRHSGFYATPLDLMLRSLGARRLILTGVSSHQCILFTANDAYVRGLELAIPRDCVTAPTRRESELALRYFDDVLAADTRTSARLEPR